jgi:alkylation response protein AidB-like acyl-CoA dehydrogenase
VGGGGLLGAAAQGATCRRDGWWRDATGSPIAAHYRTPGISTCDGPFIDLAHTPCVALYLLGRASQVSQVMQIFEGTNQIQRLVIARSLAKG